jgi:predicted dehydrogenase
VSASVALVGRGRWGAYIFRDLVALGARVTVVSRTPETIGQEVAAVRSAAEVEGLDGIVVATPTSTHADILEDLLPLGVPIFVEKPLALDVERTRRLAAAAPDRLFVMDKWRYHPGVEELGAIARSGELGAVVGLRTTRIGWGNPHGDTDSVWILAPHDLAIALEVLGFLPEPRAAALERVGRKATGIVGLLGNDPWLALECSAASGTTRREVRLLCTGGVAILGESYADHVLLLRGTPEPGEASEREERPVAAELPLLRELRAFLEHLAGGPPPKSSAAEGLLQVETIARLRELAGEPAVA